MLKFYDREFSSRLLIGTALYPSPRIMQGAIRAAGSQIVTVSLRREDRGRQNRRRVLVADPRARCAVLPNTAGCNSVARPSRRRNLRANCSTPSWIKLEVIADDDTLQPDVVGLVEAAAILIKDGFEVFPYCTEDLGVADAASSRRAARW